MFQHQTYWCNALACAPFPINLQPSNEEFIRLTKEAILEGRKAYQAQQGQQGQQADSSAAPAGGGAAGGAAAQ